MNRILTAALALSALALPALAQENAFPQVSNDAEGRTIVEYGAGARGNVVGGGVAIVTGFEDGRPVVEYRGVPQTQAAGRPASLGWVPQTAAQQS